MNNFEQFIETIRELLPGHENMELRCKIYEAGGLLNNRAYVEGSEMAQRIWRPTISYDIVNEKSQAA